MDNQQLDSNESAHINQLFEEAVQLHQQGQQDKAQALYRQVIERHPAHDQAHFLLGVTYLQLGESGQAEALISQAISLEPQNCVYYFQLARLMSDQGNLKAAQQNYKQAIKNNRQFEEAYCELANLYHSAHHPEQAFHVLQIGQQHCPQSTILTEKLAIAEKTNQNIAKAVELFEFVLEHSPNQADSLNHLAEIYLHAGKTAKAESLLLSLLKAHPNHFEGFINLGKLHFAKEEYEQALSAFERARQLLPHSMQILLYISDAKRYLHDYYAAIKGYQTILENKQAKLDKAERLQALAGLSLSYAALKLPQADTLSKKLMEKIAPQKLSSPLILNAEEAAMLHFPKDLIEKIRIQQEFHQKLFSLS